MAESGRATTLVWRKSTFSNPHECVEVAVTEQFIFVRDSKNRSDPPLKISVNTWRIFLNGIKAE
jgi:hypothetical protein